MCDGIDIADYVAEISPDALMMLGWDDCILGICYQRHGNPVVAYRKSSIIKEIMADGKTIEEAEEQFKHMVSVDHGEGTPIYVDVLENET